MTERANYADELLDVILGPNSTMRKAIERGRVEARQEALDFDPPPRSHTDDPPTSHTAEANARKRFMRGHAADVLELVRARPAMTASGICEMIQAPRWRANFSADHHRRLYQVRRRLSDLRLAGLIERRTEQGDTEARWFPVG